MLHSSLAFVSQILLHACLFSKIFNNYESSWICLNVKWHLCEVLTISCNRKTASQSVLILQLRLERCLDAVAAVFPSGVAPITLTHSMKFNVHASGFATLSCRVGGPRRIFRLWQILSLK